MLPSCPTRHHSSTSRLTTSPRCRAIHHGMTLRSVFAALGLFAGIALPLIPAAAAGFLHASGQDVVDEQGPPVLLRGVGLGNWLLPEGYMWKFGEHGDRPRTIEKL